MYSAWFSALISGIVAAIAVAIGGTARLIGSSTPDPLPVMFVVAASAVIALLAGALVAAAVRGGLHLARCRQLATRFALLIAAGNAVVLGILCAVPIQTHAIKLDMPSGPGGPVASGPVGVPSTFWITCAVALLVPVIVAYSFGRIARSRASAA